jgi:hypothetical protein
MRAADGGDGDRTAEHGEGERQSKSDLFHNVPPFRSAISGCSNLGRARFSVCELAHTRRSKIVYEACSRCGPIDFDEIARPGSVLIRDPESAIQLVKRRRNARVDIFALPDRSTPQIGKPSILDVSANPSSRLFTYPLRKIGNYHRREPMAGRFPEP